MSRAPGVEGCTDGGCMWGHPGGMHTNAGCRCEKDLRRSLDLAAARRVIMNARAQQKEIARLTRERDEARAELEAAISHYRVELEAARRRREDEYARMLEWRGIDPGDECKNCGGAGVTTYGSTATWRGGVGGQTITTGVCDKCWGS